MTPITVTEADDPRLAAFRLNERGLNPRRRGERTPPGLFVAEGDLVVERALGAGCRPVALLGAAPTIAAFVDRIGPLGEDVPLYVADVSVRRHATGLGVPLDVVALFERPGEITLPELLATARSIVVLEAVDNPTNVGAIVRSVAALGADALILDRTSADPLTRRALRVSMGAAFRLPVARTPDVATALGSLHASGFTSVALTPAPDAVDISRLAIRGPIALVVGAERSGLSTTALATAMHHARIPMHAGIDSLNVAAAAAVACYALFPRP